MSLRTLESIVLAFMLSLQLSRRAGLTVCMSAGASSTSKSCIATNSSGVMCGDPFIILKMVLC